MVCCEEEREGRNAISADDKHGSGSGSGYKQ